MQDVLRHAKTLAGWWNKPKAYTADNISWQIIIRNGDEVRIYIDRQQGEPASWILRTEFHEWAGRKNPPKLAETHITEP